MNRWAFLSMFSRAVSLNFKPFMDYTKNGEGEAVTKKDSLDVRIMDAIAQKLNFTYEVNLTCPLKFTKPY